MVTKSLLSFGLMASLSMSSPVNNAASLPSIDLAEYVRAIEASNLIPVSVADLPTIQGVFEKIQAGIDNLVKVVNAFTETDIAASVPILDASKALLVTIADGGPAISKSPALGLLDAISVLGPVSTLSNKVDEIITALDTKKAAFEKAGLKVVVADELTKYRLAADVLVKAIIAGLPLPSLTGLIANPIAAQITDKLNKGITDFGGTVPPTASGAAPAVRNF
jgi:hypothetical protein